MHKSFWMLQVNSEEQCCLSAENKTLSHLNVSLISQWLMKAKTIAFSSPIPACGGSYSF